MGKDLIIVESAAKAKTISKFLNNQYTIKASIGHVRDLPKKTLGVDIENNFTPKYVTDRTKTKVIKDLKTAAKEASEIYLASDHDREGEAIAWHLTEVLKKEIKGKVIHRIVFNEITKTAIRKAIENPGVIDLAKVDSQQARRILDRIVGYKVSPVLWRVISKGLSAGRVQSVALRIICEREKEIRAFEKQEYWSIETQFYRDQLLPFKASLSKWKNEKIDIQTKEEADKILDYLAEQKFTISVLKKSKRQIAPYPPYITSTLQQDAARLLYYSAKRTMSIAQRLYEGVEINGEPTGLISYLRTDSLRIADEANDSCRKLIKERFGSKEVNSSIRTFKNKNKAQDAHEAIRPTDSFRTPESIASFLTDEQLKLYTLIWSRFIATQMNPVKLNTVNIEISANEAKFKSSGSTITEKGFLKVFSHVNISSGEEIAPEYQVKDSLVHEEIKGLQHFTKPPARYSEASLIKELESKGIGRPSTYASITNTIIVRKYVEMIQKRFQPTSLGEIVSDFLVEKFSKLFNVEFTAQMETGLDDIEFGKINWLEVMKKFHSELEELIEGVDYKEIKKSFQEETDILCDKCGSNMIIKWGRKGQFLACPNFPKCSNIKNFTKDENGKISVKEPEVLDEKCPKCGNPLVVKSGRYGKFIACTNYPECKYTKPFTLGIKCPDCQEGEFVELKNKKGRFFYGCSNYPKCKHISKFKPVNIVCPECNHPYMEERMNKEKQKYMKCPKCGKEVY